MTTNRTRRQRGPYRRGLAIALLLAFGSLAAGWLFIRSYRLPPPTGPYAVGTLLRTFADSASRREIVVQIWYPAEPSQGPRALYQRLREATAASLPSALVPTNSCWDAPPARAAGPFPALLYSSRWNGQRIGNTALAEDLASHGYVVIAVDHPGNTPRMLLDDGRVLRGGQDINGPRGEQATAAERIAFWNEQLPLWAADERLALDAVMALSANPASSSPLAGLVDSARIGAFGHSYGGATALSLLGVDPRVRAGLNLDGWTFAGLNHRTGAQPVMILYEQATADLRDQLQQASRPPTDVDAEVELADMHAVQASLERDGGWRLTVHGSQHMDFTDQPLLPPLHLGRFTGPIAPAEIERLNREVVRAFFDQTLSGRLSPLLANAAALHQTFPEIDAAEYKPANAAK